MTDFRSIDANLRDCFRALAQSRPASEIRDLPGISILSLGSSFQMFNAAFLSGPVASDNALDRAIAAARVHFELRGLAWAFWLCEDYLTAAVQRRSRRIFESHGLRFTTEMPGMVTERLTTSVRGLPECEIRPVDNAEEVQRFREIGSLCFRVPAQWFAEIFDGQMCDRPPFRAWNAYAADQAVASAATVAGNSVIGVYNVATLPPYRSRGFAETLVRSVVDRTRERAGDLPLVLQSTRAGFDLYRQMGFRAISRFCVWVS